MTPTRAFHTGLLVGAGMLTGLVAASLRAGAATSQLPRASLGETLSFFTRVLAPVIAKGVIVRRPRVLALAEFLDLDARAVRVLQRFAHRFSPDVWLQSRPDEEWPLVPFSHGPATCPARNLALLVSSVMLASILGRREVHLQPPARLDAHTPLPGTLSHFSLRFELAAVDGLA
jgi:hypothetical protein